ncbi:MAG: hypothetical protein WBL62_00155 [Gallionella sp.]
MKTKFSLICFLLLFGTAQAAELVDIATPAATVTTAEDEQDLYGLLEPLDAPRNFVARGLVSVVSDIDKFFGDTRNYQESNNSVVQLDVHRLAGFGGEPKFIWTGRVKVDLPNTEKRLHFVLESNPDKNLNSDKNASSNATQATPINQLNGKVAGPQSYAAALRFEQPDDGPWHLSSDLGVRLQGLQLNPFARTRGSYGVPLGDWRAKASETFFVFNSTGMGSTTQLDFEHFLSAPVLFRATSSATWLHRAQNFDVRQDATIFHTLDARRALLYQASVSGVSSPQRRINDTVLLATYRYKLHREWIFFELSPQLHFPQIRQYRASPSLLMRMEFLLDKSS